MKLGFMIPHFFYNRKISFIGFFFHYKCILYVNGNVNNNKENLEMKDLIENYITRKQGKRIT